ncbi:putative early nodulin-93-like [Capsicum annuum]|nr:putative early nodulin-93-like [Capsicum annuum]
MFKSFLLKAVSKQLSCHPNVTKQLCHYPFQFHAERGMHSRNKKAMEFIAKGWNALQEVDRVTDYCEHNDKRLIPSLRNFELVLEADNSNTHARYWLSKLHLKYHVPGDCKAVGAALLVEAAEMGDPEAQFELGCRLRIENGFFATGFAFQKFFLIFLYLSPRVYGKWSLYLHKNEYVQSDQQAFYYLGKAVDQLHPGALYLLGAVFLTGDCVKKDVGSALWCFHRASQKGHAGAAIACGSLLLTGVELPESITRFYVKRGPSSRISRRNGVDPEFNPIELAREQFEIAAKAGCDLGFRWLQRLDDEVKRLQSS